MRAMEATRAGFAVILAASALVGCIGFIGCKGSSEPAAPLPDPADFVDDIRINASCAFTCSDQCTEASKPWTCPALGDWKAIPHAPECPDWDGKTTPDVVQGKCVASEPTADAIARTTTEGTVILPDGRRLAPAGTEWVFDEQGATGGFAASALLVPGTKWLVVDDTGYDVQALRVIDTAALRAGGTASPVVSVQHFSPPAGVNYGMAWHAPSSTLYASSAAPESKVKAWTLDAATGAIASNAGKDVALPAGAIPHGIAISADGKTLLVTQMKDTKLLVYSLDAATYGALKGSVDLGAQDAFAVRFDPNDSAGNTAYATLWTANVTPDDSTQMLLMRVDVAALKAKRIVVGKTPEEIAFIAPRYAVVANALSDSLSVIDLVGSSVAATVPVIDGHGAEPTALAYDGAKKRLYATLASRNAVAVFDVDPSATPPTITPAGAFPTAYWPTGLAVDPADGAVYVTNGKGHGTADDPNGSIGGLMHGSVQAVPYLDAAALAPLSAKVDAVNDVAKMSGYPSVDCGGAPYDFPIPAKIADGRSAKIRHVFFIVRENKTYDAILGDVTGDDGDPSLVLSPGHMDEIWPNARAIAAQFSHMANYYEDAEQSIQGHAWTVFGRTTDYDERRWLIIWGRNELSQFQSPGVGESTSPLEGTLFTSMKKLGIGLEVDEELIGGLPFRDPRWPGGTTESHVPDTLGGCWIAAHARVLCDSKELTYTWLPNDHTSGVAEGWPNPALMIATNDEGTGMLLDGISHSPIWPESLVIVIEDDPQDGRDHIDHHRSIALFASPWVKRGYRSHGHYDVASLHKVLAHVFAEPYRNRQIESAALPLDLFTSTPDYTPFNYVPRAYKDMSCNAPGTIGAQEASRWDFAEPDDQPGLSRQVEEYMRALK